MASTKDFYGRAFPRPSALVAADGSIQRDHPHALRKVVPRDKDGKAIRQKEAVPEAPSRPKTAQDIFEQVLLQRLRACALKGVLKELSKGQHFLREEAKRQSRDQWEQLGDLDKTAYILLAADEDTAYQAALQKFKKQYPNYDPDEEADAAPALRGPRKPLNAWLYFLRDQRQEKMQQLGPDDPKGLAFQQTVIKEAAPLWKQLNDEQRAVYEARAEDDKKRYKDELAELPEHVREALLGQAADKKARKRRRKSKGKGKKKSSRSKRKAKSAGDQAAQKTKKKRKVQHEGPWKEDDSSTGDESDIASDERWSDQDTCNDSDEEGNQEASQLLIDFQTAGADLHENQADRAGLEAEEEEEEDMNGIEDADEEENASKGTGRDIEGEQDISMLDVSISETDQPSMKHQAGQDADLVDDGASPDKAPAGAAAKRGKGTASDKDNLPEAELLISKAPARTRDGSKSDGSDASDSESSHAGEEEEEEAPQISQLLETLVPEVDGDKGDHEAAVLAAMKELDGENEPAQDPSVDLQLSLNLTPSQPSGSQVQNKGWMRHALDVGAKAAASFFTPRKFSSAPPVQLPTPPSTQPQTVSPPQAQAAVPQAEAAGLQAQAAVPQAKASQLRAQAAELQAQAAAPQAEASQLRAEAAGLQAQAAVPQAKASQLRAEAAGLQAQATVPQAKAATTVQARARRKAGAEERAGRGSRLEGAKVRKHFPRHGWFDGVVEEYNSEGNWYGVRYPADNDIEDLEWAQLRPILVSGEDAADE